MADCPVAIILAAMLVSSGSYMFTRPDRKSEGLSPYISNIIFLTAVFAWVSATDINIFRCRLPERGRFVYEFLVSMFLFETLLLHFWNRLECFVYRGLPSILEEWLIGDGDCCLSGLYCRGDTFVFSILNYALALWFLWLVCYVYGVGDAKL